MRCLLLFGLVLGLSAIGCTSASHAPNGGPDAGGCAGDSQCGGSTPRCDVASGRCVPCLPAADNCPAGSHCIETNGNYGCNSSCRNSADCPKSDAGVPGECCNGVCLDTSIDVKNCGACGKACPPVANGAPACVGGACVPSCAPGFGDCDGNAANGCESDTRGDAKNCGACGKACEALANGSYSCVMGACVPTCNAGFADCDNNLQNGCESDTRSDARNCGGCGTECGTAPHATFTCFNGGCTIAGCDSGFADCDNKPFDGCEAALGSDPANCGGCAKACPNYPNGVAACVNGGCQLGACNMGFVNCDNVADNGCEINVTNDVANCGGCRKACVAPHATPACVAGACAIGACAPGFADCDVMVADGCEVQISNDVQNCGMCANVCATPAHATAACTNGTCGGTCSFGWGDCDMNLANGCESNLITDSNNCGKCGAVCPGIPNATPGCSAGTCGIAMCDAQFGNCDGNAQNGCETSLANDIKNCGACGKTCTVANGTPGCINGQCGVLGCNAGWADCDGNAANGCEVNLNTDAKNCSKCGMDCGANMGCANGTCVACGANLVDNADILCVPQGMSYALTGDLCYASQVVINGTLTVKPFDGNAGGKLVLRSPSITISGTGKIIGDAAGNAGGKPALNLGGLQGGGTGGGCGGGPGSSVGQGGSGGGYGGNGGTPKQPTPWTSLCDRCSQPTIAHCYGAVGTVQGTNNGIDYDLGNGGGSGGNSSGCASAGGRGGNGGAAIVLMAKAIQIDGAVSAAGENPPQDASACGYHPGGGGGSGGIVVVRAATLNGQGSLVASGGKGGYSPGSGGDWGWAGGGGGGGRVKVFATTDQFTGTLDVSLGQGGGACAGTYCYPGMPGAAGTTYRSNSIPNAWNLINCGGL